MAMAGMKQTRFLRVPENFKPQVFHLNSDLILQIDTSNLRVINSNDTHGLDNDFKINALVGSNSRRNLNSFASPRRPNLTD